MTYRNAILTVLVLVVAGCGSVSTQEPDLAFEPPISRPAWNEGSGPVVQIDEAHHNFHTAEGRYAAFAQLLRRDGYVVQGLAEPATAETLGRGDVYVVANAMPSEGHEHWKLPAVPAFRSAEVVAIRDWVEQGGSLFLVADHMPFPGAVQELAAAFGIVMHNGFLYDVTDNSYLDFAPGAGLADHPIAAGRHDEESVTAVRTFSGQAFRAVGDVEPLLVAPPGSVVKLPVEAWEFAEDTPRIPADGLLQGAVLRFGKGRVAVFGEAAMFSAQVVTRENGERVLAGMNSPDATQNAQFLLNVMHWLTGLL